MSSGDGRWSRKTSRTDTTPVKTFDQCTVRHWSLYILWDCHKCAHDEAIEMGLCLWGFMSMTDHSWAILLERSFATSHLNMTWGLEGALTQWRLKKFSCRDSIRRLLNVTLIGRLRIAQEQVSAHRVFRIPLSESFVQVFTRTVLLGRMCFFFLVLS